MKKKIEKKISNRDLMMLVDAVIIIVKLHIKYIKLGFSIRSVAQAFARIYRSQLKQILRVDDEAFGIVREELRQENKAFVQMGQQPSDVASSICLKLASAFTEIVTLIMIQDIKNRQKAKPS